MRVSLQSLLVHATAIRARRWPTISHRFVLALAMLIVQTHLTGPSVAYGQIEDDVPYKVKTTRATSLRCGPGPHYYETLHLADKRALEVYKRQGGWLAVRPPDGSFSWVPASQLRTTDTDNIMEAREPRVRVWIGTGLVELNKHHFQVELKENEAVEVLGSKQLVAPSGAVAETWYKISPPAGEFRWIAAADVQRVDTDQAELRTQPIAGPASQQSLAEQAKSLNLPPAPPITTPPEKQKVASSSPNENASAAKGKPIDLATVQARAPKPEWLTWQPPADAVSFEQTLEKLNVQLAEEVSQPTADWNLTELRIKSAKMADQGPSPLHRGKARRLQASVAEFETVARRLNSPQTATNPIATPSSPTTPTGSSTASATNAAQSPTGNATYAGQGWLMPVHSSNDAMPKFAVIDDQGRFLQFVSPAPGVNLQRYVKKRVGVVGPSSYIPSLDMPHVTAQRVVTLK